MPVYDYLCARCGPFTDMRPMAESDLPHKCPECGKKAPRAFLSAPYLAHAAGERSASAPRSLNAHAGGCSCCSGASLRYNKNRGDSASRFAAKGFSARRPS